MSLIDNRQWFADALAIRSSKFNAKPHRNEFLHNVMSSVPVDLFRFFFSFFFFLFILLAFTREARNSSVSFSFLSRSRWCSIRRASFAKKKHPAGGGKRWKGIAFKNSVSPRVKRRRNSGKNGARKFLPPLTARAR